MCAGGLARVLLYSPEVAKDWQDIGDASEENSQCHVLAINWQYWPFRIVLG